MKFRQRLAPIALAFSLTIAVAAPALPETARADASVFIENGNEVPPLGTLTQTVALLAFPGGGFCSASFLSSRTLLSAAHCFTRSGRPSVTVNVVGDNGRWVKTPVSSVQVHPQYSNRRGQYGQTLIRNDLAIVQLDRPFPHPVRTVTLAPPTPGMLAGTWETVTDVGYGFEAERRGSRVLRWGAMSAIVERIGQFENRDGLRQRKTTANQNVCSGDSGGAVFIGGSDSRRQVAVHSLADGCRYGSRGASSELVWPARAWIQPQIR